MCAKYNVNAGAALSESTDLISDCQVVREIMTNEAGSEEVSFKDANDKERSFLILPEGKKAVSIKHLTEEYRTQPERRIGTAKFSDLDSFCLHVNRFKGANSVIFASDNLENPSLTCVLDYHEQGDNEFEGTHFGQHRSLYQFPLSEEWKAWAKADSAGYLDHATFAEFLEDRIDDVLEPLGPEQADEPESTKALRKRIAILGGSMGTPQRIMELSRGLKVNQNASTTSAKNLSSGEVQVAFKTENLDENGAPIIVPTMFLVAVPVFQNGPLYQMPVKLRYRVRGPSITWALIRSDPRKIFENAFKEALATTASNTELPTMIGTPE